MDKALFVLFVRRWFGDKHMAHGLKQKAEYWKPLIEVFTGFLSLMISMIALVISVYAVYSASSSPDLSAYVGRHFGIAMIRGNQLQKWDLPHFGYSEEQRFLVLDISAVFSNAGGKRSVVDHMELKITNRKTRKSINTEWKLFFIEPTNRDLEKRPELVTPLVIEGKSSQKKLIRFSTNPGEGMLPDFFQENEEYTFSLGIHQVHENSKVSEVTETYSVEWEANSYRICNIQQKDLESDSTAKSGDTALLTLY